MLTRREFNLVAMAGITRLKPNTLFASVGSQLTNGVRLGAQTYSFRDLPRAPGSDAVDTIIAAMRECGLTECELFAPQVEPVASSGARGRSEDPPSAEAREHAREELRRWRLETPLDHFRTIKKKFDTGGISIHAYNYSPSTSFTDAEIDRGFEMAKALGAQMITASTTLEVAKRIAPFAEKHGMIVSMHGHSNVTDPNEFATPDSFAAAMKMSKLFKVNLDIGHFTAANFDAVAYIGQHHANITILHLKDRKKNQGENMPWGQGDTPIREVLRMLEKERWPIRAYIEYEYRGASPVEEVKRCYAFAKQALS